jgi:hypothetical protein
METVKLAGPVVSIENMDLVRHVDARGLGETEAYLFTHEILWVRCVIPTVSFWHGAEKVRDGGYLSRCPWFHEFGDRSGQNSRNLLQDL